MVKPGRSHPRHCAVCSRPLVWPAVEFCSAACGERWIREAAEREGELTVGATMEPASTRELGRSR